MMYIKNYQNKTYRLDSTQSNKENTNPKCGKLPASPRTPSPNQLIDLSDNYARPVPGMPKYKTETEI
jgi:hypothetical protein